jgi:hypothetical protein
MLPANYRLTVKNETGATSGAVSVKIKKSKLSSAAAVSYDSEVTAFSATSIASLAHDQTNTTAQSNATGDWMGFDYFITVANGTGAGIYSLWLEISTDSGTTWPTAGESELLDSINVAASTTEKRSGTY